VSDISQQLEALSGLLDLAEFEVVEVSEDCRKKIRRLVLVPRAAVGLCPHCGGVCPERHECYERTVLDLPLGAYGTELVVRAWQFRCEHCDKFFTPRLAALAEGAHATERFLERMAALVKHADLANAAAYLGVAEKTLERWYYQYVERLQRPEAALQPVRSLGIDELSLKKDSGNSAAC
jgi:transposase